jgi:peptide/nickel transport system substrate-binding protein
VSEPESNGTNAFPTDERTNPVQHSLTRRRFVGASAAAISLSAVASRLGSFHPGASAQDLPATPNSGSSPVASPAVASPVPVASPQSPFGQLSVVDNQRPLYVGTPADGGELRMALPSGSNGVFNPAGFRQDFQIMASYLDPLVWIDEVTMEPRPWLAESWNVTRDRLALTIRLREGVRWHDDSPFTADDVVFSMYVYRDDIDSAVRNLFTNMDSAEVRDELTVVVRFGQPDGNFIANAASQLIFQRAQYIDHWNSNPVGQQTLNGYNWRRNDPIGTGPWIVGERDDDSFITFRRNDAYWTTPAHFETLSLRVVPEPTDRITAWINGDIDLLWPLKAIDLPSVITTPGTLYVADAPSVMFAAFNFDNPARANPRLFRDIDLRRALSLAIDRQRYTNEVFVGFAFYQQAGTVAQPWLNDPETVNPPRDVEGARKLLANAGYRDVDGDGILESDTGDKLQLVLIVRNTVRDELHTLLAGIVPDLAEIGVHLEVRALGADEFDATWIDTHEFDLVAYAYNLYPGFTDFDLYGSDWDIRSNIQGWNPGGYSNDDVDRAIDAILTETDPAAQKKALIDLQRLTNEDLFGLWFGFPRDLVLARVDIQGYQPNKMWQTWDTRKLWRA